MGENLDQKKGATLASRPAAEEQRLPRRLRRIFALEDLEPEARRLLPRPIFGYVAGASETNASLSDNRRVFDEIQFLPRALVDVSERTLDCNLMGSSHSLPFGIAPMGVCGLTGYRGDLVLARSAAKAGIPMIISAASLIRSCPGEWCSWVIAKPLASAPSKVL